MILSRRTSPLAQADAARRTSADAQPTARGAPLAQANSASVALGVAGGFLLLSTVLGFLPDGGPAAPVPAFAALGLRGPLHGPTD